MSLRFPPTRPPFRLHSRLFHSTPPTQKVGPESPKYIEIPRPPRTPRTFEPYVKGKLPRLKPIFPAVGPDKTSPEYLAQLTREPEKEIPPQPNKPEENAYIAWKAAMAEKRRRNLREGLIELASKKKTFDEFRAQIRKKRNEEREALLAKKEREDVRLTLPSVLSTLRNPERFRDPNREERLARKQEIYMKKQAEKRDERQEQIHDLYLHAESFILTENQLDNAIEKEFVPETLIRTFPLTVSEMLEERNKGPSLSNLGGHNFRESELVLEAASVLTGGRLPQDSMKAFQKDSQDHNFNG